MAKPNSTSSDTPSRDQLAAASREALAGAQAAEQQWSDAVDAADMAAVDTEDRLSSGDASVSALDLVLARAEVERSGLLLAAAHQAVKAAERKLISTDTRVAQAFAPVLREAVGVEPTVDTVEPRRSDRETPSLYVVQAKPATLRDGTLSSVLSVSFLRSDLLRPLDLGRVRRAWEALGFAAEFVGGAVATTGFGDGVEFDTVRLNVTRCFDRAPQVDGAPDHRAVSELARRLSDKQHNSLAPVQGAPRVVLMGDGNGKKVASRSDVTSANVVSSKVDSEGLRRTTVRVVTEVAPGIGRREPASAIMESVAEEFVGFVSKAGQVDAAEVVTFAPVRGSESSTGPERFDVVTQVALVSVDATSMVA